DVGLEGPPQLLLGDVADVLVGMLLAGVVDQHVAWAELLDRPPDRSFAERLVADIPGNRERAAALALDDRLGALRIVMLAQIDDRNVGALAGEQRRDRAADAAIAAGDQRDLALEPPGARIARLPL